MDVWGKIANDRYLERALEDYNGEGKYRTPELTWNSSVGLTALSFLRSEEYGRIMKMICLLEIFIMGVFIILN